MMKRAGFVLLGSPPYLVATAFVISSYVANAVPPSLLVRPMAIAFVAAAAIHVVCIWRLGWVRGSFWGFVLVSALAGFFALAGVSVFALFTLGLVRSSPGREYVLASIAATVGSAAVVAALVATGVGGGAFDWQPIPVEPVELDGARVGPSIHILVMDGYPRADVLRDLGFDNAEFFDGLAARGFDIYSDSQSNYDRTTFTLLSMLSMRHVSDISALWESQPPTDAEQTRVAARALLDPPVFAALEAVGYRTRVIRAPIAHVPIGGAQIDDTIDTASNFELDLPQRSVLSGLLELVAFAGNQQRSHVEESLAAFADPPTEPTFTLAHLLSPHAPFVFAADGSPAPPPPCYPATCSIFASEIALLGWSESEHWSRLIGQIEHINDLVLSAVDSITERDPDAVIVLLSDHGIRRGGEEGMIFDNLLVARTPGHERLLGTAPTTINILPAVFNAYLGTRIPPLADTTYTSGVNPWLEVVPYRPSR